MKVIVQGRNVDSLKPMIEKATRFYAKQLFSTRMANTLTIVVKLRKTTVPKKWNGFHTTSANGSKASKKHNITIKTGRSNASILSTLAHEMVHVQQTATNKLQVRRWKSDKQYHIRWNGKEMGIVDSIPYRRRPWEVEAFNKQNELADRFMLSYCNP